MTVLGHADQIQFQHDGFEFHQRTKPPHDFSYQRRVDKYGSDCRVVYLTRDPRDTMVSLYYQITGRLRPVFNFDGDISEFIRDDWFGAENLRKFRAMWEQLCACDLAIKVTYEEAHDNFEATLGRVLSHYGFNPSADDLARAKRAASFQNMKKVEQSETFPKNWLRPKNGAVKVRKGKVGGYADTLSTEDIAYLNAVFDLD